MRIVWALILTSGALGGCPHGPGVPREIERAQIGEAGGSGPAEYRGSSWARLVLRALTQELWELGAPGQDRRTDRDRRYPGGRREFVYQARGPVQRAFFLTRVPTEERLHQVYSGHCRAKGAPRRGRAPDGARRTTYLGVEPRSGARCVLHVDVGADQRWRFRIVLSRRPH